MCDQEPKSRTTSLIMPSLSASSMSRQEPKSRSTATSDSRTSCQKPKSSPSSTSANRMSCQKPKSSPSSSSTATSANRMSCQKSKTSSTSATSANRMSCQKPKSRTTSLGTSSKSGSTKLTILILFFAMITSFIGVGLYSMVAKPPHPQDPKPTQWPDQFHSIIVLNNSGVVELVDLWYDWTNGRSFNIIQRQVGSVLYDLELNNGTSYYYTVGSHGTCSSAHMEVKEGGILKPNWFDRTSYVGQREVDGSLCNVWENAESVTYYEDVVTKLPVQWVFYAGREAHVMTFEVGAALEDAKWQVPCHCFEETNATELVPMDVGAITRRGLVATELTGIDAGAITHLGLVDSETLIRLVTRMKEWSSTFLNFSEQTNSTELVPWPMDVGAITHQGLLVSDTLMGAVTRVKEWSSSFLSLIASHNHLLPL